MHGHGSLTRAHLTPQPLPLHFFSAQAMYSVLAPTLDGCTVVAAGAQGNAQMWRLEAATLAVAETYRLPQARYGGVSLTAVTALSSLPHRPHLVMGCTREGCVAVWDTWRRQLVLGVHVPGLSDLGALAHMALVNLVAEVHAHKAAAAAAAAGATGAGVAGVAAGCGGAAAATAAAVGGGEGALRGGSGGAANDGEWWHMPTQATQATHAPAHMAAGGHAGVPAALALGPPTTTPAPRPRPTAALPNFATPVLAAATATTPALHTGGWSTGTGWGTGCTKVTGPAQGGGLGDGGAGAGRGVEEVEQDLRDPRNPLVLLAVVEGKAQSTSNQAGRSAEHGQVSGCVTGNADAATTMAAASGRPMRSVAPVLVVQGLAHVLPALDVGQGVVCCSVQGSVAVVAWSSGAVALWDVVGGRALWGLAPTQLHDDDNNVDSSHQPQPQNQQQQQQQQPVIGQQGMQDRSEGQASDRDGGRNACVVFCAHGQACVGVGSSLLLCTWS